MRKLDLSEFISPGDLVFDVGANVGAKTTEYLKFGARVICFEPNEEALQMLHEKFDENLNVTIESIGLYDHEGIMTYFPAIATAQSTFSKALVQKATWLSDQWKAPQEIQVSTLALMFKKYGVPKFVKIDVEDAEQYVLKGMDTAVRALSFEFYPSTMWRTERDRCIELVYKIGYTRFNYIINGTVTNVGVESDEYRFDDWVNIRTLIANLNVEPRHPGMDWGDIYARFEENPL